MPRGMDIAIPQLLTGRNEVRAVCDTNCDLIVSTEHPRAGGFDKSTS